MHLYRSRSSKFFRNTDGGDTLAIWTLPQHQRTHSVIAHDHLIQIPGEGMPKRGSYSHKSKTYKYGDLTVQFAIAFPDKLEKVQQVELRKILMGVR